MKALLDTNILIHREATKVVNEEIGTLFNWLDRLHYVKCIYPLSLAELRKHSDEAVVKTIQTKLQNYNTLKTEAPEVQEITAIRKKYDRNENDNIDTPLLKELFCKRVDCLITEDRKIHEKAQELGISDRVFTIDDFLEKVIAENPGLSEYKVLSVRKEYFGNINIDDPFFDSFKEDYSNITPTLPPKVRLKIGTLKVNSNGYKLGERFLKIIFDNALRNKVDEIYVTLFQKREEHERLIGLIEDWGFKYHGIKNTPSGSEKVFIKDFHPSPDRGFPKKTYPFISTDRRYFVVPIYPEYHTELLPDSILNNESPQEYIESEPHRNAIQKVYISRSVFRDLVPGDVILFYRTGGYYKGVMTTIGVVDSVVADIKSEHDFIRLCRKRSVFNDAELKKHWNWNSSNRPFVVNFLYLYSFPKRPNLKSLIDLGIIRDISSAPRGFEQIEPNKFKIIMEASKSDESFIIN